MGMTLQAFRAAHGRLIAGLHGAARSTVDIDLEVFTAALWKSAEKSGVSEARVPDYLRSLRVNDLALTAACVAGSEAAWKTFMDTLRTPLRAAGRAMAGDQGEELADALFGEMYAAREARLGSYGGRSSLAGWMRAVLRQTWIDRWRATKRLQPIDENGPEPAAHATGDPAEEAQTAAIASRALDHALSALPPRQKLLLDFYYFQNLNLREAASLVGVHEATASRELDRARAALRESLTAILKKDYGMDERRAQECLLEAVSQGLEWRPAQETPSPSVLLKERL